MHHSQEFVLLFFVYLMNQLTIQQITGSFIELQTALSIFFQEAAIPPCPPGGSAHFGQVSINIKKHVKVLAKQKE